LRAKAKTRPRSVILRIAIEAHMVRTGKTANETYVSNLLKVLAMVDQTNTYDIYTIDRALLPPELGRVENFQVVEVRLASSFLRIPFAMPYLAWRRWVNILHVNYIAPPFCSCPTVVGNGGDQGCQ